MAVTMKNAVFWDVTPCGSYKNQRSYTVYSISLQHALVASYC
jgi:hypothetical protein